MDELPDIRDVNPDLTTPPMEIDEAGAGRRVRHTLPGDEDTEVHHALYLPADWRPGGHYPVLVEYPGNGPYQNGYGDICTGRVEDCNLGYGISGGKEFIWICLPFVNPDRQRNQLKWWGDVDATVDYCKRAVHLICEEWGGDPSRVILSGFSRGAIACNYIGLREDRIAGLWRAVIAHSHYDGVRAWGYEGDDRPSALKRLQRLGGRPQFISHEGSIDPTARYVNDAGVRGNFTFLTLPYRNHTDAWVLRDIPERKILRGWLQGILEEPRTG